MKKNWMERSKRKKLEEQRRKAEALKKAGEIARFLKDKYEVKQIILFGSLAWRTRFSSHSDIDLCIVGFPENASYWEALACTERIAAPFPLNLALKENIHPRLAAKIEKEGVSL
jgi:predicted nucleotidyltransferase